MPQLNDGQEYPAENGGWIEFQTLLNGGTAILSCRKVSSVTYSEVKTLEEGFIDVKLPREGFFKVDLTGSAEVYT